MRTDGCRVISELEKAIAILFIYLFILNILTYPLSSVGCKTWGREAETCLVQPLGSYSNFGCPCTGWMIWWLRFWSIQLYTDKKCGFISPLLLWWEGIISSSHTKSAARGCLCTWTAFLYRNPLKFPKPWLVFYNKQKLLIHMSFSRFQSLSASLSVSAPAVYMSSLPGYLLQITGLGLCWLVAWSGALFLSSV